MAKREIKDLDIKVKLTNEYLNNGGVEKIWNPGLLQDLMQVKYDFDGKVNPDSVTPRVNAFMLVILGNHLEPPVFHPEYIAEYASTLQKSNSFDQVNIDTKEDFDRVYEEYKGKSDTLFRGLREAKWRLYSTLQRHWITERLFEKEASFQEFIEKLVKIGAEDYGEEIKKILKENHIDALNSIAVLGYLQHHGCPTPLLDWTYSFQNALFFALDNLTPGKPSTEIEEYLSVYFIEEEHFEGANIRLLIDESLETVYKNIINDFIAEKSESEESKRKYLEKEFTIDNLLDKKKVTGSGLIDHATKIEHLINITIGYFSDRDKHSGILFSLENSQNILNQQGVFTWNADPSKPIELVGDEWFQNSEADQESDYKFCSCFNIKKSLAEYIRQRLEQDGITRDIIYPTPDISTWEVFEKAKNQ